MLRSAADTTAWVTTSHPTGVEEATREGRQPRSEIIFIRL